MRVYLLRHGATDWSGKYLGRTDLPLSPEGRGALVRPDFSPERVYASPLRRAAETAEILFPDAQKLVVPDFREMDFGIFEGRSWRDMADFPPYRAWVEGGCVDAPPGGESKADFSRRVCAAFEALVTGELDAGAELLAVVAHGGTQMAALERFALPRRDYFDWTGPLGGGFVLSAARWKAERVLTVVGTVRYTV